jgi:translation initiation factor 1
VRNSRLVYSSEGGRVKDTDPHRETSRRPGPRAAGFPDDGVVRVVRDRSGRGGKVVTVIHGLPERGPALDARASDLRRLCGAGGTVKDGVVEIQGDHRERVAVRLRALGYAVKLAGG